MSPSDRRDQERDSLLERLHHAIELPMVLLGLVWLVLLVVDLTQGLSPLLLTAFRVIWGLFIVDFLLEFVIAPRKLEYLRHNWLTALSLLAPAFRVFVVLRATTFIRVAGAARGARLVAVLGSINRGMRALGRSLEKRGFTYVIILTLVVVLAGAAGMYSFERGQNKVFDSYGNCLWWTAMIMTTMGSGEWPETAAGRILCFLLAMYSFTILGYITAALASFFVGQDKGD